jgi:hypothetical protein
MLGYVQRCGRFEYIEPVFAKDEGLNIRHKAKALEALLLDVPRLTQLRAASPPKHKVRIISRAGEAHPSAVRSAASGGSLQTEPAVRG